MPVSLYTLSVPVFIKHLNILNNLLTKGEEYATANNIPLSELLETRLAPDMAAFPFQIQRVSDTAKGAVIRVAGVENVSFEDTETTFPELHARIEKTIDFLKGMDESAFEGKDGQEVVFKTRNAELKFTSEQFLLQHALPNFFFHVTTAYAILRHKGVPIGKTDYMGRS
ncbi:hypothetical protein K432DRAFT_377413 [Lepidopterella palustris CBS 459.81]|uniref:DUF1993 domain-containing protein n=1 Tax=Lepidopterella palustris CBS 459.81 TaxID=1314670 RepID=A0A8E2EKG1_9PEZI|nr:hypothetical protein K432DRAFT_377413 [Lepidopterella palustris CBS 459.81]